MFFLKVLHLWEDTLSRYVPFFPLWLPIERCSSRLPFRAQFNVVPIFGSIYAIWNLCYGAILHKQTPKEVILLVNLPSSVLGYLYLPLGLCPGIPGLLRRDGITLQPGKPVQGFILRRMFKAFFGFLQSSTRLILFGGLLKKSWPWYSRAIFYNKTKKGFFNT